jgi:hypothetical protein
MSRNHLSNGTPVRSLGGFPDSSENILLKTGLATKNIFSSNIYAHLPAALRRNIREILTSF